ncbi:hypothetical protein CerSpe_280880 [Prunus speciosa]
MATKSKAGRKIPNHPKTKKTNLKGKQNSKAAATIPHLPVLVILHILQFLPTKLAIRTSSLCKQWAELWSSIPVLDFDEDEPPHGDENLDIIQLQRTNFINFLDRCLEFHQKCEGLDKFRLRMTLSSVEDKDKLGEWLCFAVGRRVKELDISLKYKYETLLGAKSLTSLNLKYVRVRRVRDDNNNDPKAPIGLPYLKTMSLEIADLYYPQLISGSPSLEHLSVSFCFAKWYRSPKIPHSSSLKSLEVRDFDSKVVQVSGAKSLESFTLVSEFSMQIESIQLDGCKNLKHLSIRAPNLPDFTLHLHGCEHLVKAHIPELDVESSSNVEWEHFSYLTKYLGKFEPCKNISLYVDDAKALIFPKKLRRTCPPPLPTLNTLTVSISSPRGAKDCDLRHSLF